MHYIHKKARCGPEIATFRTKTLHCFRVIRLNWLATIELRGARGRNFFFYHGFADLLRHIRILSILRAHFGLIRCIHRQINARGRLAYRLVITGKYA